MIPFSFYFFLPNSHFLPPFGWARSFKVVGVKFPFEDTSLAHPCWTVPQTPAEMTPSPPPKAAHSTTWGSGWPCAPAHQAKSTSCLAGGLAGHVLLHTKRNLPPVVLTHRQSL